jgi:hypothetical protein
MLKDVLKAAGYAALALLLLALSTLFHKRKGH